MLELEDRTLMFEYKCEAGDVLPWSLAGIPCGIPAQAGQAAFPASPALPGSGALPRMQWLVLPFPKAAIPAGPETMEGKFLEFQDALDWKGS